MIVHKKIIKSFQTCFLLWNTSSITSELLVSIYLESYGVGMSLGWINNDKIVFGWTISLRSYPYFLLFIFKRSSMGRSLCTQSWFFCPALFLPWSVLFKVLKPLPQLSPLNVFKLDGWRQFLCLLCWVSVLWSVGVCGHSSERISGSESLLLILPHRSGLNVPHAATHTYSVW